ncbi:cytochrome c oxidase assembly protein COX16 homolog, mitochondrial isoform X2 [Pseudoliparis swirei]|uniref:cytochrome c oxidase assembly protein COX16 homolog, mitochondrial isoform X2 n=1 Tax=Pseudoliparis swirei TaxID=2059687 RepID=UPI0024BDAF45|nr:cytochrome c oxidase assembly protein COX16 homolog, mitochondrial isoform X2 [Pseudoliparis swirei]
MFNLKALKKNKTLRYGVPMLLLVVGGSFGLREFTQIRYDAQRIGRRLDPSLEAKVNVEKQSVILEEQYENPKGTTRKTSGRARRSPVSRTLM